MDVTLSIDDPTLDIEDLQTLTRDLCTSIRKDTDSGPSLPESKGGLGTKGDPITIGTIALAFFTSGTAVSLFAVFRAYFERNSTMVINIERGDGEKMSIKTENLTKDSFEKTIDLACKFIGV